MLTFTLCKNPIQIKTSFCMHEMSIAINIIEICEKELQKAKGTKIEKVNLIVGKLSGIVIESLNFALEVSKQNGLLSDAEIIIEEIPASLKCLNCGLEFTSDEYYTTCPACNDFKHEILAGKELLVKSLTIV